MVTICIQATTAVGQIFMKLYEEYIHTVGQQKNWE
jgi:hypothetical protein